MEINTFHFGKITVDMNKVVHFPDGLLGFPDLKDFISLYDKDRMPSLYYLQSIDDPDVALTVVSPLRVTEAYSPSVKRSEIGDVGELSDKNIVVLVTVTIPENVRDMTANLQAPILINTETRIGKQVIVEDDGYDVKYPVYDYLEKQRNKGVTACHVYDDRWFD